MYAPDNRRDHLQRVTESSQQGGETEYWISDPERRADGGDDWAIGVYAGQHTLIATFVYAGREAAWAAHHMLPYVLQECTFIELSEDGGVSPISGASC
jgi:hypothetical protein